MAVSEKTGVKVGDKVYHCPDGELRVLTVLGVSANDMLELSIIEGDGPTTPFFVCRDYFDQNYFKTEAEAYLSYRKQMQKAYRKALAKVKRATINACYCHGEVTRVGQILGLSRDDLPLS